MARWILFSLMDILASRTLVWCEFKKLWTCGMNGSFKIKKSSILLINIHDCGKRAMASNSHKSILNNFSSLKSKEMALREDRCRVWYTHLSTKIYSEIVLISMVWFFFFICFYTVDTTVRSNEAPILLNLRTSYYHLRKSWLGIRLWLTICGHPNSLLIKHVCILEQG